MESIEGSFIIYYLFSYREDLFNTHEYIYLSVLSESGIILPVCVVLFLQSLYSYPNNVR